MASIQAYLNGSHVTVLHFNGAQSGLVLSLIAVHPSSSPAPSSPLVHCNLPRRHTSALPAVPCHRLPPSSKVPEREQQRYSPVVLSAVSLSSPLVSDPSLLGLFMSTASLLSIKATMVLSAIAQRLSGFWLFGDIITTCGVLSSLSLPPYLTLTQFSLPSQLSRFINNCIPNRF